MEDKLLESLSYVLPSMVTGVVVYFIFSGFLKQGITEKKFEILSQKKKDSLPIRLQAYERMLLFCERINPVKILLRIKPIGETKEAYLQLLKANIEQEFEHNLVQQLYISDDSWKVIIATKTALINQLNEVFENSSSASDFRENAMRYYSTKEAPTEIAIAFLKKDVKRML